MAFAGKIGKGTAAKRAALKKDQGKSQDRSSPKNAGKGLQTSKTVQPAVLKTSKTAKPGIMLTSKTAKPGVMLTSKTAKVNNPLGVEAFNARRSEPKSMSSMSAQPKSVNVQAKLEIGSPDDAFEKEADAIADKVTSTPEGLQKDGLENEKDEELVQLKIQKSSDGKSQASPALTSQLGNTKGSGQSLPKRVQGEMGSKIGADFSGVKVHSDNQAASMSSSIGAKAFTHGNDIYFNKGEYNPTSKSGKHLLAHELTHTVQQGKAEEKVQLIEHEAEEEEKMVQMMPEIQKQDNTDTKEEKDPLKSAVSIIKANMNTVGSTYLTPELVQGLIFAEEYASGGLIGWIADAIGYSGSLGPGQMKEIAIEGVDKYYSPAREAFSEKFGPVPSDWKTKAEDPPWSYFYVAAYLARSIDRAEIFHPTEKKEQEAGKKRLSNEVIGRVNLGLVLYHTADEIIELRRDIAEEKGIERWEVSWEMVNNALREKEKLSDKEKEVDIYISTARGGFDFNFTIKAAIRSRRFYIPDRKVKVSIDANYKSKEPVSELTRGSKLTVTLYKYHPISDVIETFGSVVNFKIGIKQHYTWTNLPKGEYRFDIKKKEDVFSPDILVGSGEARTIF